MDRPDPPSSDLSASSQDDATLIARSLRGDRDAFGLLVRRYQARVFTLLCRRCRFRQDAEDLCQQTFIRAWMKLDGYDSQIGPLGPWLFAIAVSISVSHAKKAALRVAHFESSALAGPSCVGPTFDHPLPESQSLWSLVDRTLDAESATIMWLRYGEDLRPAQIARVLGKSGVTVRVNLVRARQRLLGELRARGVLTPYDARTNIGPAQREPSHA